MLQYLGHPPVPKPNPASNYGPPTPIVRPSLRIPTSSSRNPTPPYEVLGTVNETAWATDPVDTLEEGDMDDDLDDQHKPYAPPTATDCLRQAYNFNRDSRRRNEPFSPHNAIGRAKDLNDRRQITKRHNSRAKRALPPESDQRDAKWESILRRENKSAAGGRVRGFVFLLLIYRTLRALEYIWVFSRDSFRN